MAARAKTSLAVLGCWLAALGAAGCGADEEPTGAPLPRAAVAELDKQLGSIERRFAFGDGACGDIERGNRPAVRRALARLSAKVDPDVRRVLRQSFGRLFELARRQCAKHKPPPTRPAPAPPATLVAPTEPATPSPPAPATTETTPTDTTTLTDTAETTPTTKTAEPAPPPTPDRSGTQPNKPTTVEQRRRPSQPNSGGSGGSPAPKAPAQRNPAGG